MGRERERVDNREMHANQVVGGVWLTVGEWRERKVAVGDRPVKAGAEFRCKPSSDRSLPSSAREG